MAMAQLSGRNSLRYIVENVSAQAHRLYHLGSVKLSHCNLSRINGDKPYTLYAALFEKLLKPCQCGAPGHNFRFKNPLPSLYALTIDLCLSVFPWADFRTTKGAIKLHVGLNHSGYLPEFITITEGKDHDVTVGRTLNFSKGSIVAVDKGYNDYSGYKQLTNKGLSCNQTIEFTGIQTAKKCPTCLRRIGYRDPETGKHYIFLTNNFKLSAKIIADVYKARRQVELFFK